jgi:hypothetical protein
MFFFALSVDLALVLVDDKPFGFCLQLKLVDTAWYGKIGLFFLRILCGL